MRAASLDAVDTLRHRREELRDQLATLDEDLSRLTLMRSTDDDSVAEEKLVGACLELPANIEHPAVCGVALTDFALDKWANAFAAIRRVHAAGLGVTLDTVEDRLREMGQLDGVGGIERLAVIDADAESAPSYAATVMRNARRRRASQALESAASRAAKAADDTALDQILSNVVESFGSGRTAHEWPPLTPLTLAPILPDLPVQCLPPEVERFCRDVEDTAQVPVELPAGLALAILATTVQRKFRVAVGSTHEEPISLFVAVVANPGERKSEVFRRMTAPIEEIEKDLLREQGPVIEKARTRREIAEKRLAEVKNRASKCDDDAEREALIREAEKLAIDLPEVPPQPKLIVGESTPERAKSLLAQHGRIAAFDADAEVFDIAAGRYNNGAPSFGPWLKGHAGDDLRVERGSRPDEHVTRPALSAGLCVQPGVVQQLGETPAFRRRGLTGRFFWVLSVSRVGTRFYREVAVDAEAANAWRSVVRDVHALPAAGSRPEDAHILRIEGPALAEWAAFANRVEADQREGGRLARITDWASKAAGAAARIAGILHIVRHRHAAPWTIEVGREDVRNAVALVDVLTEHALAAYALMDAPEELIQARWILGWLDRTTRGTFTLRDVHRARGGEGKPEDYIPALEALTTRGYIRELPGRREGPGRKPSPAYEVRPEHAGAEAHASPQEEIAA